MSLVTGSYLSVTRHISDWPEHHKRSVTNYQLWPFAFANKSYLQLCVALDELIKAQRISNKQTDDSPNAMLELLSVC
eukprot:scaffold292372_cov28-Prasinocladus_malaysianus.AAC.1